MVYFIYAFHHRKNGHPKIYSFLKFKILEHLNTIIVKYLDHI